MTTNDSDSPETAAPSGGGSRAFGPNFVVRWEPATLQPEVQVTITCGQTVLAQIVLTVYAPSQHVAVTIQGCSFEGNLIAEFGASGTTGSLFCSDGKFATQGTDPFLFTGLIGIW
jgi:hypothetical protein